VVPCRLLVAGREYEVASGASVKKIPVVMLELDAEFGVYGERLAGLLLLDYELDCDDDKLRVRVEEAARTYRRRVTVEQVYDLAVRLGPMISEVEVRPSYVAVSRMSVLSTLHGCRYEEYLARRDALARLDEEFSKYVKEVAEPAGTGWYRPKAPRVREAVRVVMAAFRGAGARLAKAAPTALAVVDACPPRGLAGILQEPWRLARIPEGHLITGCRGATRLASRYVGEGVECRALTGIASTVICRGSHGVVVVKEYYRMAFKWIAARAVSTGFIRYRVTPKSRLAAEYKYFRALRGVAGTPRVYGVCVDYNSAMMAREFVEGKPVLESKDPEDWRVAAALLASIHGAGYIVGDPNPGNIVVTGEGEARLIDAEQARRYNPKAAAWDLAVFMTYARMYRVPLDLVEEALREYRKRSGQLWSEVSRILASARLWINLSIAPMVAFELQRLVKRLKD
jgi:tRNA A-37 threonylcarbamoyl transferase component Bud32